MTFTSEITGKRDANVVAARAAAAVGGLTGTAIRDAVQEGQWVAIAEVMLLPSVVALTAGQKFKADALAADYIRTGWELAPGNGADLDTVLSRSRFRNGPTGTPVLTLDQASQLIVVLRVIGGLIDDASLFVPHGQPTAPKSRKLDGIAVKFETDHLCPDKKSALAATQRRAIARSTMLQDGEAILLSREIEALNQVSYFQYVEAYLQQRYSWSPSYMEVDAICYVSKSSIKVGWEVTGTASTPGGAIDTFTNPTPITGHLIYAVKPDGADANAAVDPGKCKRLLYHLEGMVPNAATAPPARGGAEWVAVTVDLVLKAVKLKPGMEASIRAAAIPCYYRASDV